MRRAAISCLLMLLPTLGFAQQPAGDAAVVAGAGLATEPAALLKFFSERTPTEAQQQAMAALIRRLGDDSFEVREQATEELAKQGPAVATLVRQAVGRRGADVEVVRRGERVLATLKPASAQVVAGAARLLAQQKPAGAAAALLAYLPFAEDAMVAETVRGALVPLAPVGDGFDPALVQALKDDSGVRRGAAVEALVRAGSAQQRADLRRFLSDTDVAVRLRTALAFVEKKEKEAVPALIAVLGDLPRQESWQAEELLTRLAGDQAPAVAANAERKKVQAAWAEWWTRQGPTVDLARLDGAPGLLGFTLIVQIDARTGVGQVVEVDARKQVRWQINNLEYPVDAQVLRHDRVLVAEYNGHRVTERSFAGDVLWEKLVVSPIAAQRLPNGQTFIACHNQLIIVDSAGKEVFSHLRPNHDIMAAVRLPDGQFFFVTNAGSGVRLDSSGKEIKNFMVGQVHQFAGLDALPNGKVLLPQQTTNKVVEIDADGKVGWSAPLAQGSAAQRLANGNTLAASFNAQRVVELDPAGKTVNDFKPDGRPWKVRRR